MTEQEDLLMLKKPLILEKAFSDFDLIFRVILKWFS